MGTTRPSPRPEVAQLPPSVHGAAQLAELRRWGLSPDDVIDFSANVNPFGPPPGVLEALRQARVDRYPDPDALPLREALAAHHGLDPARVIVGNGVSELILLTALAFIRPGDPVALLEPTYGEYRRASGLMAARVLSWRARPQEGFRWSPDAIGHFLRASRPRLVWLCRPNNPTGNGCSLDALASWTAALPDTLFVVDEAYINLVPNYPSALTLDRPNILVLRSMTKDFALPGVRLGYAMGDAGVIAALERVRPPWSVNACAVAAGLAALDHTAYVRETVARWRRLKEDLTRGLAAQGWPVVPSDTPFFLVEVGDARGVREALLAQGILVRDGTSFGLPEYVRISARQAAENEKLVAALARWKQGEGRRPG